MRRVKKSVVVVTMMLFSMMLFSMMLFSMTNVHAANKKLKVNKVYTTTKKIKGKTKKKWKLYTTKIIKVKKKKISVKKYPGKEEAIDLEQVKKDLATGKEISKGETALGKGHYYYLMNFGGLKGDALIGYVNDYIDIDTDGEYVTMKAINGAKLYYTVAGASEKSMTQLEEPTFNSEHLEPRQKVVFSCYDFNKNANRGGLYLKVHAYKNGKLIAISYESHYMIHMIPGFYY